MITMPHLELNSNAVLIVFSGRLFGRLRRSEAVVQTMRARKAREFDVMRLLRVASLSTLCDSSYPPASATEQGGLTHTGSGRIDGGRALVRFSESGAVLLPEGRGRDILGLLDSGIA